MIRIEGLDLKYNADIINKNREELVINKYNVSEKKVIDMIKDYKDLIICDQDIEYIKNRSVFFDDIHILKSFNRIVIGAHGPYIEFEYSDLLYPIVVPRNALYRLNKEKFLNESSEKSTS